MKPRPTVRDDAVIDVAVNAMVEHLLDRFPDLRESFDDDRAGVRRDVREAIVWDSDGYERAKRLDDKGWFGINSEMVEVLEHDTLHEAERNAVQVWVKAESVLPSFALGVSVTFKDYRGTHVGEIVRIDTPEARYVVFVEALGHVRSPYGPVGSVVPYEACELATLVAAVDPVEGSDHGLTTRVKGSSSPTRLTPQESPDA